MTKLINAQIIRAHGALTQLLSTDADFPVKFMYAARKNLRHLSSAKQDIDETRQSLLHKYGEKDDDGNLRTVTGENGEDTGEVRFESEEDQQDFIDAANELHAEETDVPVHTVSVDNAPDELNTQTFFAIEFMLDD